MGELTIVTLCQALSNLTHNRCNLIENSNTCRCIGDVINPVSSTVVSMAPDIMLSEVCLIFFVLTIWLSAIGFCLNQYKSLRRLETQVHYCVNRKDPLNIGEIKIVTREQDSIIYKKKRYSTIIDSNINNEHIKAMHYVQQYLPKNTIPSTLSALVVSRDDLTANVPLSTAPVFNSSINIPLSTHHEVAEDQSTAYYRTNIGTNKRTGKISYVYRTESARLATGLTVPHISSPNSLRSSWNSSSMYETSCSTQHLCVPSNSLRSNRYSDGNISLPVPQMPLKNSGEHEQLIDPRLIPETVRRSLLALHRESQENINMQRHKEKTQSENDVHGSFTPWKMKMKSKLKRTHHHHHHHQQQQSRPHSNTLSILPVRNDHDRRVLEYVTMHEDYRYSTPPSRRVSRSTTPILRRSLKYYPKYSTQSTSESETTQGELPMIASIYVSADDNEPTKTIIETNEKTLY